MHARFLAGFALGADVYRAGGIFPNQHRCQTRLSALGRELGHLSSNLGANGLRDGGSVQNFGRHRAKSTARVSRITTTLICPGSCNSLSIFRAIDSESWAAAPSSIRSGVT